MSIPSRFLSRLATILFALNLWIGSSSSPNASAVSAAEPLDPTQLQVERRGSTAFLRKLERPSLIERLSRTADPVELDGRELAYLEAYLTANSRPRREFRDEFYARGFAHRGPEFDDPENRQLIASANVSADEWQRLRTHLLFNRALQARKADPAVVR